MDINFEAIDFKRFFQESTIIFLIIFRCDNKMVEQPIDEKLEKRIEELERECLKLRQKADEFSREKEKYKRVEEALQKSEERYKLATRAARVGVWDWNIKTGEFHLDANVKAILGYRDEEIPNDLEIWAGYVHPDDKQPVMDAFQAHIDGKTPEYAYEHRMQHKVKQLHKGKMELLFKSKYAAR